VRGELLPAHDLAVSGMLGEDLLTISLKKDEALQYLRKEEVTVQTDKKGWALVRYEGYNLGWLKVLQNRSNNYYPKEWRILKSANN
jgi:NOL1/NOP2/fmu family ribosome biogenesis protein